MPDSAKPFPNYTEMPAKLPTAAWVFLRLLALAITGWLIVLLLTTPQIGLKLIWGLFIPLLPLVFAIVPGLWRQICPMAFVNQLPRGLGFGFNRTLPVGMKNLAYYFAAIAFFVIVSLRHVSLNHDADVLAYGMIAVLIGAFAGGVVFKGRSGWCGTFCPLAPIQRTYGQAPVILVRNGYCPTCVGCQKNCYDFNPRAAIHSDLADPDRWYSGHKEFFTGALPGFILAFFLAPGESGLIAYFAHIAFWMILSLGLYMALTRLLWISIFKVTLLFSMAALAIFYWFAAPIVLDTASELTGLAMPSWSAGAFLAGVAVFALAVTVNGLRAEADYRKETAATSNDAPRIGVDAATLRAATTAVTDNLVVDRGSGRSFPVDPAKSLLQGIESVGVAIDFGCRMGMCGADPIVVVEGADALSKPSGDELATLRRLGLEGRARMACVCRPLRGGVVIDTKLNPRDLPEPAAATPAVDLGVERGIAKVVIIGNGTAGTTAAAEVRRLSPSCQIDVVARESLLLYNRMAIGRLLYGRTAMAGLHLLPPDWHEQHGITVWLNTVATGIDLERRTVELGTGEALGYDRLILAQGGSAVMPPIQGSHTPGCFVLREAADAMAIRAWRQQHNCRSAVVIGGGVLGIEAADALRQLNLRVTILQNTGRLMDRQLDERGSTILTRYLEGLGMSVRVNAAISGIKGAERVSAVELAGGEAIDAEIVVACAGVQPNAALARAAGLNVNRGVVVDAIMRTSDPNVYAVGDVAELPGALSGLWAVGTSQAATAVAAMFGNESGYVPPSTLVSLKMDGIDVKGFGSIAPANDAQEVLRSPENRDDAHRLLIVENGRIVGAVFVGPPGVGKHIGPLIQANADLTPVLPELREGRWDALGKLLDGAPTT
jgi:nitrite reductase (NADH) large subunit